MIQRMRQAEGMRQLPGQCQRLLYTLHGLVWIAQVPQHMRYERQ